MRVVNITTPSREGQGPVSTVSTGNSLKMVAWATEQKRNEMLVGHRLDIQKLSRNFFCLMAVLLLILFHLANGGFVNWEIQYFIKLWLFWIEVSDNCSFGRLWLNCQAISIELFDYQTNLTFKIANRMIAVRLPNQIEQSSSQEISVKFNVCSIDIQSRFDHIVWLVRSKFN